MTATRKERDAVNLPRIRKVLLKTRRRRNEESDSISNLQCQRTRETSEVISPAPSCDEREWMYQHPKNEKAVKSKTYLVHLMQRHLHGSVGSSRGKSSGDGCNEASQDEDIMLCKRAWQEERKARKEEVLPAAIWASTSFTPPKSVLPHAWTSPEAISRSRMIEVSCWKGLQRGKRLHSQLEKG